MHMDGAALFAAANEINANLQNGRVERIAQPTRFDIVFTIRAERSNTRLLISADPEAARMHLCGPAEKGPDKPFPFLMVLRKYLLHGRLLEIRVPQMERACLLRFLTVDELGDRREMTLIAEIMGKHSNLILVDDKGMIVDSVKRVTPSMSSLRTVLPGEHYRRPPGQPKHSLPDAEQTAISQWIEDAPPARMGQTLVNAFYGISPFTAEQICRRAGLDADDYAPFSPAQIQTLAHTCAQMMDELQHLPLQSVQLYRDGKIDGFAPFAVVGYESKATQTFNDAVYQYYQARRQAVHLQRAKAAIQASLSARLQKLYKRLQIQDSALRKSEGFERYRQEGELILAYAYQLKRGMRQATLFDYTQDKEIALPLDPTLTPSENAAKRFKRYQKAKATLVAAQEQKEQIEPEIAYLESVCLAVEQAEGMEEIEQIRAELQGQRLLPAAQQPRGKRIPAPQAKPLSFVSSEGIAMLAGRNNAQNDLVTTRLARSTDTWLHAQGMPGSHVVIQAPAVPRQTLLEAAHIAAYFSRGKHSSNVPIDYTLIKNVHKPSGAKPGFVTYTSQKTIFITPDETLVKRLIQA